MKKIVKIFICIFLLGFNQTVDNQVLANSSQKNVANDIVEHAEGAYLIEHTSGKVIFAKNPNKKLYPASMTKMMGLLLIFEALNSEKITWNEQVVTSDLAASMGGSQVFLEVNESLSVRDMIKSICIASANDAMVAMGEQVAGSNASFVSMMNDKAKSLKLDNTNFTNATGLHDENHYTCAKDMALIASALINEGGEELLKITATYDAYIREASKDKFWLVNTNKLLKQCDGVDGLKTGFTSQALSCITATSQRDGLRLIGVVMKEPSSKERNIEMKNLLEYGYSQYEQSKLYEALTKLNTKAFEYGKPNAANIVTLSNGNYIYQKGKRGKEVAREYKYSNLKLPLRAKTKIGVVNIKMSDGFIISIPIGVDRNIYPVDYMDFFLKAFGEIFA